MEKPARLRASAASRHGEKLVLEDDALRSSIQYILADVDVIRSAVRRIDDTDLIDGAA
jgi:hypothetical protein